MGLGDGVRYGVEKKIVWWILNTKLVGLEKNLQRRDVMKI